MVRDGFWVGFDQRTRNAHWTAELLTKESLQGDASRKGVNFREDQELSELFRAKLEDYKGSGFDRGHLVPAGDMKKSQAAMRQTFLLSNISPQVGKGFNRNYWERLERWCREITSKYHSVLVLTGPLYLPTLESDDKWYVKFQMIGEPPNVAVPTHFFKIVACESGEGAYDVAAFVLPNTSIKVDQSMLSFRVPLMEVERASGLTFFSNLNREDREAVLRELPVEACILPEPFRGKTAPQNVAASPPRLESSKL